MSSARSSHLTLVFALLVAYVLSVPVAGGHHHADGILARSHEHRLAHGPHQDVGARALGAGGSSPSEPQIANSPVPGDAPAQPQSPSLTKQDFPPPVAAGSSVAPGPPVQSQEATGSGANSSPVKLDNDKDNDTPAEDVLEKLDELFGDSIGTGPSDDWRDQWEGQPQPEEPSPPAPATQSKKTVTVQETEVIWITSTVHAPLAAATPPPAPLPPQPQAPPSPPPPSSTPAPASPPPPAAVVAKPQPTPQEQPIAQPPQTVEKPQPTQKEPAGSPATGSVVNTNGLPTKFVDNLDCHSPIYQGLSKLHHDIHRTNHSLTPLAWNDTLFEYAKETAETCIYGHSLAPGGGGYGQNIAAGDAPGNITAVLTNAYYNAEIELFFDAIGRQWGTDQPDMSNFEKWGHATQMLWKTTTSFACYTAICSPPGADPLNCKADGTSYLKNVGCGNGGTKAYNTVCNYYPPGNYAGEYSSVPAPKGIVGFVEMTGNGVTGLS